jgi:hypothetical protein
MPDGVSTHLELDFCPILQHLRRRTNDITYRRWPVSAQAALGQTTDTFCTGAP